MNSPVDEAGDDTGTEQRGDISYENAREELAEVVAKLESGSVALAESLELWERGEKLAKICSEWLDGARARVAAAQAEADNTEH